MSEYQYVGFRAIDAPVSGKDLEFMRKQSTRAEVTPTSFDNEYHFGDFHGDASAMLRRGYDFHMHYANFGTRTLMIRLPNGLPDPATAKAYFEKDSLFFTKDKGGDGGVLLLAPGFESGQLDELEDPADLLDDLLPLREEIISGDLRPLYLADLAVKSDMNHDPSEEKEGPVPAGLDKLSAAQKALLEFFGLERKLVAAAARESPPLPKSGDEKSEYEGWLARLPEAKKSAWLAQLMIDADSAVRREMLAEFRKAHPQATWPTRVAGRSIAELMP